MLGKPRIYLEDEKKENNSDFRILESKFGNKRSHVEKIFSMLFKGHDLG